MEIRPLHRSKVYQAIGVKGDTIPKEMGMSFLNVTIDAREDCWRDGTYTGRVTVFPATGAYAKHRVFVYCQCGKQVPSGRYAQHAKVHVE